MDTECKGDRDFIFATAESITCDLENGSSSELSLNTQEVRDLQSSKALFHTSYSYNILILRLNCVL